MRLFIPTLGTILKLSENVSFTIYKEQRNKSVIKKHGLFPTSFPKYSYNQPVSEWGEYGFWRTKTDMPIVNIIIETGSELRVDQIYIRKGAEGFDSITFRVMSGEYKGCRFWAKLDECNQIQFV